MTQNNQESERNHGEMREEDWVDAHIAERCVCINMVIRGEETAVLLTPRNARTYAADIIRLANEIDGGGL